MTNKIQNSLIAVLAFILIAVGPVAAQTNPEELLESGVYKADVEGDLEGAIEIFENIIAEHADNREATARALLHLGSSYERLGNLKAEDAYQRLIDEYGDQQAIVSEARMRLQKIRYEELAEGIRNLGSGPTYQIVLDEDTPEIRPLAHRQYDFSPGGGQIAYQTWGGLYVSDATGTLRRPLVVEGEHPEGWQVIYMRNGQPRWSPDGKQIAYFAGKKRTPDSDPEDYIWTIFVINAEGGEPRKLVEFLDPAPYGGLCWTPDGTGVSYLVDNGVMTLDLEGKTVSLVDLKGDHHITNLAGYSPDGRWLTLRLKNDFASENNYETDIFLVPSGGGRPVQVTMASGYDGNATWSRDGHSIYFVSSRAVQQGSTNIWKVQVDIETGKPLGDPEQVTFFDDARIVFPRVVGEGDRIAFMLDKTVHKIHVAPDKQPENYRTLARGTFPALSPDGKTVYYVGEGPDQEGIFAVSTEGDMSQRLTSYMPHVAQKDLSPDGKSLTYFTNIDEERGLYVHPVDGGEPVLITKTGCDECCTSPRWSPDGKSIAYIYMDGIYLVPSSGGEARKLATLHQWEAWTLRWSPDGQHLAALGYPKADTNNAVYVVPVTGGEPRMLSGLENYKEGLEWHPDGKSLTYHLSKTVGELYRTWLDGRPPEPFLNNPKVWDYTGKWAPDGKRFFVIGFARSEAYLDVYDTVSGEITHFAETPHIALPEWSKDGTMITWTTEKSIRQLWLMENFK